MTSRGTRARGLPVPANIFSILAGAGVSTDEIHDRAATLRPR
jgi:hypothetical protein